MDHATAQNELQAYLDGALAPDRARAVRAHLEGCAACRAELALLREVDQSLRAWPVVPEPEGLTERVMAALAAEARPTTALPWAAVWPWLRERWSEVLLGAVLAATIVVLVVSVRALGAREAVDLGFWELQVERALATVERAWYVVRANAGRGGARGGGGSPGRLGRKATECYVWAASAIVLLAGAVSAGLLAQQWRPIRERLGGWAQHRRGVV
jgi:hypothetical protein